MIPSAQQFLAAGIDPSRVLLLHPRGGNGLLAIEQALRSGNCGAVLVWLQQGDEQTSRRLRRAAEVGRCWGVLFRSSTPAGHEAPVAQYQLGLSY
jgi:cell division inhibitor SulA